MFVWKPVTILKLNLYLNLRMKSLTCWECVESLCTWITELQKISNLVLWQLQIWKTKGREQRTLNSNKEPFQHKRVLQNATACKEPLKNHIFLECGTNAGLAGVHFILCDSLFNE